MSARIRHHIRSNVVGYVAIFLFAIGGTAYATHPGGANTISSGDIIDNTVRTDDIRDANLRTADIDTNAIISGKIADGAVQSADVANNSLTGDDVQESSLRFTCFRSFPATRELCFGPEQAADDQEAAAQTCAEDFGHRLPTPAEARLVHIAFGEPDTENRTWWTTDYTADNSAISLTMKTDGSIGVDDTVTSSLFPFICVHSPFPPG